VCFAQSIATLQGRVVIGFLPVYPEMVVPRSPSALAPSGCSLLSRGGALRKKEGVVGSTPKLLRSRHKSGFSFDILCSIHTSAHGLARACDCDAPYTRACDASSVRLWCSEWGNGRPSGEFSHILQPRTALFHRSTCRLRTFCRLFFVYGGTTAPPLFLFHFLCFSPLP